MKNGRISKHSLSVRRSRRLAVLRMLSATENSTTPATGGGSGATTPMGPDGAIKDFLTTGRTGRRNAMPDILGEHAVESTGDLPERLEALTCSPGQGEEGSPGTSGVGQTPQRLPLTQTETTNTPSTSS